MAPSILWRIWGLMPKWLLIGSLVCLFTYYAGVSHGREPYKSAIKLMQQKLDEIASKKIKNSHVKKQEVKTIEKLKNYECIIDDNVAGLMSDVK